jgi:hypothetical protein
VTEQCRSVRPSVICVSSVLAFAHARSHSSETTTSHLFYNQQFGAQLHVGQSPRYMESCPRFEYLFLATYSLLPTTRPLSGPAVYAPKRRTNLSLAGPARISPPSVSLVPSFRPAIRRLPLGIFTYFYLCHCPSYHRKMSPQPFLSHCQPLHPKPPKTSPSLSPSSPADYSRPARFSASTDPVFFHVTATSKSGIWNSTTLEIFKNKTISGIWNSFTWEKFKNKNEQDQFPIRIHVILPRHLSRSTSHSRPILRTHFQSVSLSSPTSRSTSLSSPISSNLFPIHDSF